jgi:hypothetical protein
MMTIVLIMTIVVVRVVVRVVVVVHSLPIVQVYVVFVIIEDGTNAVCVAQGLLRQPDGVAVLRIAVLRIAVLRIVVLLMVGLVYGTNERVGFWPRNDRIRRSDLQIVLLRLPFEELMRVHAQARWVAATAREATRFNNVTSIVFQLERPVARRLIMARVLLLILGERLPVRRLVGLRALAAWVVVAVARLIMVLPIVVMGKHRRSATSVIASTLTRRRLASGTAITIAMPRAPFIPSMMMMTWR